MQIKKKSLVSFQLAYDEMFLYINILVIKMYKDRKKSMEQTASGSALIVSLHGGTAVRTSLTAVTDIQGCDNSGHCKRRRE